MSTARTIRYSDLARAIALRANQLADAINADEIETNYTGALADILAGVEVPLSALKRDIIVCESLIASMIGNSSNIVLRRALMAEASVTSGDEIPQTADGGGQFVGKYDGLFDDRTGEPLELADKAVVSRRIRNAGGFYRLPANIYCIEGTIVLFSASRPTATLRGCAWKRSDAEAAYAAGEESVMPQAVESLWQHMVLARLAQENWFISEAGNYNSLAGQDAQSIGLILDPGMISDTLATNRENANAASENR